MTKNNVITIGAILLAALFILAIVMNSINDLKKLNSDNESKITSNEAISNEVTAVEPQFVKEGSLSFVSGMDSDTISSIAIEVALTPAERNQGLMFRSKMDENTGMLFVFDMPQVLNFWMKNTILSLDIIYADENFKIVSIYKSAIPFSETQIPSYKNSVYVVEVVAGYTNKYKIKEGDLISFKIQP